MRKAHLGLVVVAILGGAAGLYFFAVGRPEPPAQENAFTGSSSCKNCHKAFYERWAPSHHGLAMQPYSSRLARERLSPQSDEISIGDHGYRVDLSGEKGFMTERGAHGEKRQYPIEHVMGGKNVYYFLTSLDRGRLQVLPLAYDVRRRVWYDTAASAVRHFPDMPDSPLHWTERPFTFNSSCWSCHVSQLETNYDAATGTYKSAWAEPGINCETCHGPAAEHVRLFQKTKQTDLKTDARIIKTHDFNPEQMNALCAPCHAKMVPLTNSFRPGDRYFDHFDLVGYEHPDFYPDGRDLGENYTYTLWRSSPCVKSGKLDCLHCHTSSGRYRFESARANDACLPCHQDKVSRLTEHTHHSAQSAGSKCISCHMPMTEFARMRRSDHSMRPPTPAATLRFQSPNACNICHGDRDAAWADKTVRTWHKRDYQAPALRRAALIDAARKREWSRLPEMLAYIESSDREEITSSSLVRLLRTCDDASVQPAVLKCLKDRSPMVRACAAEAMSAHLTEDAVENLKLAAGDEYRVVRIKAAFTLSQVTQPLGPVVERAMAELEQSLKLRADDPASLGNLGNFYANRRVADKAVAAFEASLKMDPNNVPTLVNASLAYNQSGRNDRAEEYLRRAVKVDPKNSAAQFNLGLLLGEVGRAHEAKQALTAALNADPQLAAAAYNLCVLEGQGNPNAAVTLCRKAAQLRPDQPKYAYTLAFFQYQSRQVDEAAGVLEQLISRHPTYQDARALLAQIRAESGRR